MDSQALPSRFFRRSKSSGSAKFDSGICNNRALPSTHSSGVVCSEHSHHTNVNRRWSCRLPSQASSSRRMTNGKTAYPYHPQAEWNVVGGRAARLGNNPVRGQLLREQTLPAHERLQATERSLGWLYWLPNPLFPFIWYRVGLPGAHPALLIRRRTK